ncbi:MAG: dipicolinate synthase subunit DpsA [Clostridia bacterium]|nr:dipicolinate synthase subunit DpsA [Clostridia bacterium]
MYRKISVIGGDLRIVKLIELLVKDDFLVYYYGLENAEGLGESENLHRCSSIDELIDRGDIILGPVPMTSDRVNVSTPFSENRITIDELVSAMKNREKVFLAGKITDDISRKLDEAKVKYIDLLKREELVVLNTISTAEGTIQILMEETQRTLHGSNILIMGFGRVGKVLAKMLDGIGANVTCEARKDSDIAWIKAYGYKPIHLSEVNQELGKFDIIINTIPFTILDDERLGYVKKDCTIIDLSSNPGGVDRNSAKRRGLKLIWALSLPGKVAPITSAEFIKETIGHILKEM